MFTLIKTILSSANTVTMGIAHVTVASTMVMDDAIAMLSAETKKAVLESQKENPEGWEEYRKGMKAALTGKLGEMPE